MAYLHRASTEVPSISLDHVDCHMGESETKNGMEADRWYYRSSLIFGAPRECESDTNTVVLDVMIEAPMDTSRIDKV